MPNNVLLAPTIAAKLCRFGVDGCFEVCHTCEMRVAESCVAGEGCEGLWASLRKLDGQGKADVRLEKT